MDPIENIEQMLVSAGLPKSEIDLEGVREQYSPEHFSRGYSLIVRYASSSEILEVNLKFDSFEYTIYNRNQVD